MHQLNQYRENILIALHTLREHKLRSSLTILGVVIGVVTVIVISSILTGMRSNIISLVEEYGTHNIYAFHLTTGPQLGPRDRREWQRKPLTVENAGAIKREALAVADVSWVGFSFRSNQVIEYQGTRYTQLNVQGVSPNHATVTNIPVEEGRFISSIDNRHRSSVVVLGTNVVEALFPHYQTIVGRTVTLNGRPFTVIGLLEKRKSTFFGASEEDNLAFIPYQTLRKIAPSNDFLMIVSQAKQGQLGRALGQTEAILRRERGLRYNEPSDFDLSTADRMIQQFDSITATVGLVAIAISAMGLLVGGIGVMNIMLVSVTERTREIGVRKAIGARRRDITFQFLVEAITLSTTGGTLGIIFAVAVSYLVGSLFPSLPTSIPAWAVVTGFIVSVSVGLFFGVWPAMKAARLDPIECLRYE